MEEEKDPDQLAKSELVAYVGSNSVEVIGIDKRNHGS